MVGGEGVAGVGLETDWRGERGEDAECMIWGGSLGGMRGGMVTVSG
jgi:hypothetical protein